MPTKTKSVRTKKKKRKKKRKPMLKGFARRAVRLRKELNLTQKQFAIRVGAVAMTVSRWERGLGEPRGEALQRFETLENPNNTSTRLSKLQKKAVGLGLMDSELITLLPHLAERSQRSILGAILKKR